MLNSRTVCLLVLWYSRRLDSFHFYPIFKSVISRQSRLSTVTPLQQSATTASFSTTSSTLNANTPTLVNDNNNSPMSEEDFNAAFVKYFDDSLEEITHPIELKQHQRQNVGREKSENRDIPEYLLGGVLIRNGPSCFGDIKNTNSNNYNNDGNNNSKRRYDHIFDGLAKLTRYEFTKSIGNDSSNGNNGKVKVLFSTKFVRSKLHEKLVLKQQSIPPHAAVGKIIPPYNTIEKIYLIASTVLNGGENDNSVVNIAQIGKDGKWVCTTDGPAMTEFDIQTLDTVGSVKFKNAITSWDGMELLSTAHPQYNKYDDCLYNYFLEVRPFATTNMIHIVKINNNLERTIIGSVEAGKNNIMPYIHDFSITQNYAVLVVPPVTMPLSTMMNGEGFMHQTEWLGESMNTKIYVFDIHKHKNKDKNRNNQDNEQSSEKSSHNDEQQSINPLAPMYVFEAPSMFLYHHVNCYESTVLSPTTSSSTSSTTVTNSIVSTISSTTENSSTIAVKELVLDVTGYETPGIATSANAYAIRSNMKDEVLRSKQEKDGRVYRYRLPLSSVSSHTATAETVSLQSSSATQISNSNNHNSNSQSSSTLIPVDGTTATASLITPTILPMIDSAGLEYTGEMARIDDTLKGNQYRYSYSMTGFTGGSEGVDICDNLDIKNARGGFTKWALVKRDHVVAENIANSVKTAAANTKSLSSSSSTQADATAVTAKAPSALIWSEDNCYPSEPIFVRNPNPSSFLSTHSSSINSNINDNNDHTDEDDGVLLSEVYDANKQESFLLILCAKTMKEITRFYIGQIRPASFHGQFIPAAASVSATAGAI